MGKVMVGWRGEVGAEERREGGWLERRGGRGEAGRGCQGRVVEEEDGWRR